MLLKAGADVNETVQPQAGRRAAGVPRAGSTPLHLAAGNAHYELAAFLIDQGADPNANGPGYTALHMIPSIRKPGGGDNDPAPDGSGNMTSLQFVKFLAEHGANLNARMTRKVSVRTDQPEHEWRDAILPGRPDRRRRADALPGEARGRPVDSECRQLDAADRRRGLGDPVAGRGRGDGERGRRSAAGRARARERSRTPSTTTARRRCTARRTRTFRARSSSSRRTGRRSTSGTARTSRAGRRW